MCSKCSCRENWLYLIRQFCCVIDLHLTKKQSLHQVLDTCSLIIKLQTKPVKKWQCVLWAYVVMFLIPLTSPPKAQKSQFFFLLNNRGEKCLLVLPKWQLLQGVWMTTLFYCLQHNIFRDVWNMSWRGRRSCDSFSWQWSRRNACSVHCSLCISFFFQLWGDL